MKIDVPRLLTVVVPVAGRGSRFLGSRYVDASGNPPKPLIDVAGKPMVWWALQSLATIPITKLIFVAQAKHQDYQIAGRLHEAAVSVLGSKVPCHFVWQQSQPQGQLHSTLLAEDLFDKGALLVAGADTFVQSELGHDIVERGPSCDGLISVANLAGDRWSFARTDEQERVVEVAEKIRISDHACTGLYFFSDANRFCSLANELIQDNERTGGEFYLMPIYNRLIKAGGKVELSHAEKVLDLGTPDYLDDFLSRIRSAFLEML